MVTALPVDLPTVAASLEGFEILPGLGFKPVLYDLLVNDLQGAIAANAATERCNQSVQVEPGQHLFHLQSWPNLAYKVTACNDPAL